MCFDHGESIPILREGWRRARKSHRCDECGAKAIQPGDLYLYAAGVSPDGFYTWSICEDCNTLAAFVVAHEVGEGCVGGEARPPVGGGHLIEDMEYAGLSIDPDKAPDEYEHEDPRHFVVRWEHIDAARAKPFAELLPFEQMVATRLGLAPQGGDHA
jgi:hypothetical protein